MKYSVLMSVYCKENPNFFNTSIESMLNQTKKPDEIVIVKNGKISKELEEVLNKHVEKNKTLYKIIELDLDRGVGVALNKGVQECKNEWIVKMDSDDYSVPERCEMQINVLKENPNLDIIGSNVEEFCGTLDNVISHVVLPEKNEDIIKFAKRRCPFRHPAVMLRKSKILEAENYKVDYIFEDYDLWIRMIQVGAKSYNIQKPLVYMRISKEFYKRRGGIKYLKTILKFRKDYYKKGFFSFNDYVICSTIQSIVILMPNNLREKFYKKILRKSNRTSKIN